MVGAAETQEVVGVPEEGEIAAVGNLVVELIPDTLHPSKQTVRTERVLLIFLIAQTSPPNGAIETIECP